MDAPAPSGMAESAAMADVTLEMLMTRSIASVKLGRHAAETLAEGTVVQLHRLRPGAHWPVLK